MMHEGREKESGKVRAREGWHTRKPRGAYVCFAHPPHSSKENKGDKPAAFKEGADSLHWWLAFISNCGHESNNVWIASRALATAAPCANMYDSLSILRWVIFRDGRVRLESLWFLRKDDILQCHEIEHWPTNGPFFVRCWESYIRTSERWLQGYSSTY